MRVPPRDLGEGLPHAGDAEGEVAGRHDGDGESAGHAKGDLHVHLHELQHVVTGRAQLGDVGQVDQPVVKPFQAIALAQETHLRARISCPVRRPVPARYTPRASLTHSVENGTAVSPQ